MKLWHLSEKEWALVIENATDANHPTIKMSSKTNIKTPDGIFSVVILFDEAQARKIARETRPLKVDFADRDAVLAWLKQNDGNKTGLTGRAARYIEWQAGDRTQSGREMAAQVASSPWYVARAFIEQVAKEA